MRQRSRRRRRLDESENDDAGVEPLSMLDDMPATEQARCTAPTAAGLVKIYVIRPPSARV